MYPYSTSTSSHFTLDSLRNICFREEGKKGERGRKDLVEEVEKVK